jgi:hypothetical protein
VPVEVVVVPIVRPVAPPPRPELIVKVRPAETFKDDAAERFKLPPVPFDTVTFPPPDNVVIPEVVILEPVDNV